MSSQINSIFSMTWQRFAHTRTDCHQFLKEGAKMPIDQPLVDEAPPWRQFMTWQEFCHIHAKSAVDRWQTIRAITSPRAVHKASSFFLPESNKACKDLVMAVNAALALRRPLLLTGQPGSGKTSLAFVIADWLGLGPVLEWPVSPGALLADALAVYNPLARLQDLEQQRFPQERDVRKSNKQQQSGTRPVEDYLRLGPVGTAFLPAALPRVLLIDEIDKGDLNLANELLHLFEEGKFAIPELQRAERDTSGQSPSIRDETHGAPVPVMRWVETWDEVEGNPVKALIHGGQVQCHEFPLVVMSSNGEREFPPAFYRRCLRVHMPDFNQDKNILRQIVASHLQLGQQGRTEALVEQALSDFAEAVAENKGDLATDQLLNLAYLMDNNLNALDRGLLKRVLLQGLNSEIGNEGFNQEEDGDNDVHNPSS